MDGLKKWAWGSEIRDSGEACVSKREPGRGSDWTEVYRRWQHGAADQCQWRTKPTSKSKPVERTTSACSIRPKSIWKLCSGKSAWGWWYRRTWRDLRITNTEPAEPYPARSRPKGRTRRARKWEGTNKWGGRHWTFRSQFAWGQLRANSEEAGTQPISLGSKRASRFVRRHQRWRVWAHCGNIRPNPPPLPTVLIQRPFISVRQDTNRQKPCIVLWHEAQISDGRIGDESERQHSGAAPGPQRSATHRKPVSKPEMWEILVECLPTLHGLRREGHGPLDKGKPRDCEREHPSLQRAHKNRKAIPEVGVRIRRQKSKAQLGTRKKSDWDPIGSRSSRALRVEQCSEYWKSKQARNAESRTSRKGENARGGER